ncbi:hypothetical protein HYZ41_03635 [archaeon]|nr:hypothetical protein [archaeon]
MVFDPVSEMKTIVQHYMSEQQKNGKLSKAHGFDHVENVSNYAGVFASYLAKKIGVDPEKIGMFAKMAGYSHDIIIYASEVESGEDASARFLESLYNSNFSKLVEKEDYERLVADIVRNSDKNFEEMQKLYSDDPEAKAVALSVVAGDKLIEASGPRVLERRSFFVGGERMKNKKDLGAVFSYPEESPHGVLSETFVRLGDINHISNYFSDSYLLRLAQELHVPHYQWYKGLILVVDMTEEESLNYLVARTRSNDVTKKLADRTEKGGKRLVSERHLDGTYFNEKNLNILSEAVKSMPDDEDLKESSSTLVSAFANAESPEFAIEVYKISPYGPPTFRKWMDDVIAYRKGTFADQLIERLQD